MSFFCSCLAADRLLVMAPAGVAEERWPPVFP
jgi:hypothetical protein